MGALVVACGGDGKPKIIILYGSPEQYADLRADSNRDGQVRFDDESDANKMDWDDKVGAVFLANIDDDNSHCHWTENDDQIALCNDAADEVINGEDDALDLARLKTRPVADATDDMTANVNVDTLEAIDRVRLFYRTGPDPTDLKVLAPETTFTASQIRAGLELAIEAKDIVRDRATWDGFVNVRFTINTRLGPSSDTVRMRVAPVMTYHHLLPAEEVWVSNTQRPGNAVMRTDLRQACVASGLPEPTEVTDEDPWAQDFFEPAYMSMPKDGGTQHVIRVNYRSANVYAPQRKENPLRPAGTLVFRLRGKDIAGVQQFDIAHDPNMDTLNSFGNLETIPPHTANGTTFPFGRILRGETKSYFPDRAFETMLEAQGQQPAIHIDTSWLLVGHVDETLSFVKAPTPRGWKLLVNDARLAKKMLEEQVAAGHGDSTMFAGKLWFDENTGDSAPAEISIEDVLADSLVMQASAEAAAEVDTQLAVLKKELALAEDEIIHVPFLHHARAGLSSAYQPGTVNGVYLSDSHFAAPDPHGPVIDGRDIFREALARPLAEIGITTDFIEEWDEYHVAVGEVHCGTNATRRIPDAKWWESGR
ncbi:MAG: protein-arginine deiminase family protein [Labilithrix sp.]